MFYPSIRPEFNNRPHISTVDVVQFYDIIEEVLCERGAQEVRFGQQNHNPDAWLTILVEEVGEVSHAINEDEAVEYRKELIQVAAVAIAMLQSFDREVDELNG